MSNQQQAALQKRLVERRKQKEMKSSTFTMKGRGRGLKADQFKDLAAVLEFCFGELDLARACWPVDLRVIQDLQMQMQYYIEQLTTTPLCDEQEKSYLC